MFEIYAKFCRWVFPEGESEFTNTNNFHDWTQNDSVTYGLEGQISVFESHFLILRKVVHARLFSYAFTVIIYMENTRLIDSRMILRLEVFEGQISNLGDHFRNLRKILLRNSWSCSLKVNLWIQSASAIENRMILQFKRLKVEYQFLKVIFEFYAEFC